MSDLIEVVCECGKVFRAKPEFAGRTGTCRQCGAGIRIPLIAPEVENVFVPLAKDEPVENKRPFWKDPIVLSWFLGPAIVIGSVWFYLDREARKERIGRFITKTKAKADQLEKSGQHISAYDSYEYLFKTLGDNVPPDPQAAAELESARSMMKAIEPLALNHRKGVEKERLAKEAEEKRITDKIEDIKVLSQFKSTVKGDAWVETVAETTNKMRGHEVLLLKETLGREEISEELKEIRRQAQALFRAIGQMPKGSLSYDEIFNISNSQGRMESLFNGPNKDLKNIDLVYIYTVIRQLNNRSMDAVINEGIWPLILKKAQVYSAHTNIEGHFEVKDVTCGYYYAYAYRGSKYNFVEWLFPLKVGKGDPTQCDFFNGKATLILNPSDIHQKP